MATIKNTQMAIRNDEVIPYNYEVVEAPINKLLKKHLKVCTKAKRKTIYTAELRIKSIM